MDSCLRRNDDVYLAVLIAVINFFTVLDYRRSVFFKLVIAPTTKT